jgi:hypothetical protein
MNALPIACDSTAFGSSEAFAAHLAEGRRLILSATERRELDDGWALRLPGSDDNLVAYAHWILGERRCCPFLTFAMECRPEAELWIRVTGPEGTKEIIRHELEGACRP